jgi:hypothetical protein
VQCNGRVNKDGVTPQVADACVFFCCVSVLVCLWLQLAAPCHMRRRIHACHMRRRITALYVFAAGARSEPMRATSRHKRRRMHACHMRRRIHARSEPMRARRRTARKQYSKLFLTHDLCVLRICVHVDVRACARAHIYVRTCTFADNFAHIQTSTKVSASERASSCRPGLGFRVYTHTHTQAHSM